MLVLIRKSGQSIVVPGCDLTITVVRVTGNRVRLGITAHSDVAVHREEIWQQINEDPSAFAKNASTDDKNHRLPRYTGSKKKSRDNPR